jgi:hypothetical protein
MDEVVRRFAAAEVDRLGGRYARALAGNPAGRGLLVAAVERSVGLGYEGWCAVVGEPDVGVASGEDLWGRWSQQRDLTPEAERWPERLAERNDDASARVLGDAAMGLIEVGDEFGLTTGGRGRGATVALADVGRQAAEAGAALRFALDDATPGVQPPRALPADAGVAPVSGDTVRVASAANTAECELIQGFLLDAGIPSTWQGSGGDASGLLAFGYRDIHVLVAAAPEARVVLARTDESPGSPEELATRAVGLERPTLRRFGVALSALVVVSGSISGLFLAISGTAVAVIGLLASWLAAAAIAAWIELRRSPSTNGGR